MAPTPRTRPASLTCRLALALVLAAGAAGAQLATPPAPAGARSGGGVVVRVYYRDRAELDRLARELDVWQVRREEGYALAAVSPAQRAGLEAAGLRVEVDEARTAALDRPTQALPGQLEGIPGYPCYRTVEETMAAMQNLAESRPDLVSLVDIGDSWEKATPGGAEGYDLQVLVLTRKVRPGPKAVFFLMAEAHARELVTAETAIRFAESLVAGYGTDPDVTWLLDYSELHVLVMTNPDGRKIAEQGYYQRKNTNNTNGGSCAVPPSSWDGYGTDLNRNCTFKWGGAGTDPCEQTYQGPTAVSEPEDDALQAYVASIIPDQRGPGDTDPAPVDATGVFMSLHSASGLVLWPWGWSTTVAPNGVAMQTLGRRMAYHNSYTPQQATDLYATTGTHEDWAYGTLGVPAYVIEMGTDFFQDCTTYESTVDPTNRAALMALFKNARRPYMTPSGPESLSVTVSPSAVVAGSSVVLAASANDTRYAGGEATQNIAAARYTVDQPSWTAASSVPMTATDGAFNAKVEGVRATIDTTGWTPGRHLLFVESRDASNTWGVPGAAFLCVAVSGFGPAVTPASAAASAAPGVTVTYTLEVTNTGQAGDTYDVTVSGNAWTTGVASSVGPIGTCASRDLTVSVQVPAGLAAGAFDTAVVTVTSRSDPGKSASATLTTSVAAGIAVSPVAGLVTTEGGGSAQLTVVLKARPSADVTIPLASSDGGEGAVWPTALTFTPTTWALPQAVTVTGVDDAVADGAQAYEVVTAPVLSADAAYAGLDAADAAVTNADDDVASFAVDPGSGLVTTEGGETDTLALRLTSQPLADVTVALTSSDATEVLVSPASLVFTAANWNEDHTVTVTGQDDALVDGSQPFAVITGVAASADASYQGKNPPDATGLNLDDESADLAVVVVPSRTPVTVGQGLEVLVTTGNAGLLAAHDVTVTITVPAGLAVGTATPSQGSCAGSGPVTCTLGTLERYGAAQVTLGVTATSVGAATVGAAVAAAEPDPRTVDNQASTQVLVSAFGAASLAVDSTVYQAGRSNLNGVFEPGELVAVAPAWRNFATAAYPLTSTAGGVTSNSHVPSLLDAQAGYGTVAAGATASCLAAGNCLALGIGFPAQRPTHWDAGFVESLSDGSTRTWTVHVGASFADIPTSYAFYREVETLLHRDVTQGCTATGYCPASRVTRGQMAMFIARAVAGSDAAVPAAGTVAGRGDYSCGPSGTSLFSDVAMTASTCRHVHLVAAEGITLGCGTGAAFCPGAEVSRAAMAMFMARAVAGSDEAVPAAWSNPANGRSYDCTEPTGSHFGDVAPTAGYCRHANYLWARAVVDGCAATPTPLYCPASMVTRGQMAKFLVNAFALSLATP